NKRKANALQRAYDDLERRIARIAEEEDLARVRPALDGNETMRLLGIPPGPLVGKAWRHLREVRLERVPREHEEAVVQLLRSEREPGLEVPNQHWSCSLWSAVVDERALIIVSSIAGWDRRVVVSGVASGG